MTCKEESKSKAIWRKNKECCAHEGQHYDIGQNITTNDEAVTMKCAAGEDGAAKVVITVDRQSCTPTETTETPTDSSEGKCRFLVTELSFLV